MFMSVLAPVILARRFGGDRKPVSRFASRRAQVQRISAPHYQECVSEREEDEVEGREQNPAECRARQRRSLLAQIINSTRQRRVQLPGNEQEQAKAANQGSQELSM